ncbi:MAG: hypothetical protein LBU85_11205 [Treponema sp.]|nr:hypothetical protein [Treponema sp.]
MEQITDESVVRLIKQLVDHYRTNISNRFIRPVLMQLQFDEVLWGQIESLTERFDQLGYQGYHMEDLYRQISALGKFVDVVRRELAPTLRYRIGSNFSDKTDKVLRDMAINNFSANVQVFGGLIYELYNKLIEIDTASAKGRRPPIYKQYEGLADIEEKLLGDQAAASG